MLRLDKISKVYKTSDTEVHALRGVSLCFRPNEFVSILGPSGCGKTTTLNIIGGLDHATGGDLFINGVSTKDFKAKDWDVYRNRRIGFVFQSYNLIPQSTIQENVELALAIGGLKKKQRAELAQEALDRVGLAGLYSKRPSQLSGGQCQRVAIARALVNKPDIILADEPTGALDSETSIQIMDLIKEVARDKLVIMVTHNPDIAERYSTRIIRLLDGEVESDSNAYLEEDEIKEVSSIAKDEADELATSKAKMSWWTAFKLSAKNLWVKKKRTILTIIASSVGIVGVSAVMAMSNGVHGYIGSVQDDMLSGYPISVSEKAIDLASLMNSATTSQKVAIVSNAYKNGKIDVDFAMESLISISGGLSDARLKNEITDDYVDFVKAMPRSYYAAMNFGYGINVKNNLFTHSDVELVDYLDTDHISISAITSCCETILENVHGGEFASYSDMVDGFTDAIHQALGEESYVLSQYDVVAGHYPREENELMLVLNHQNKMTEFMLTLLGYYGQDQFANAVYYFQQEANSSSDPHFDPSLWEEQTSIDINTLLSKEYVYYPNDVLFVDNPDYDSDVPDNQYHLHPTAKQPYLYSYNDRGLTDGLPMKVVGILTPKETVAYGCLESGLYYTPKVAERFLLDNGVSAIAREISVIEEMSSLDGYPSYVDANPNYQNGFEGIVGFGYRYALDFEGSRFDGIDTIGSTDSMSAIMSMFASASSSASRYKKSATLSLRNVGGNDTPGSLKIYPNSFDTKYQVTDYLDLWNKDVDIVLSPTKTLTPADRDEIKYTDNLAVIINLINGIIDIVTIALIAFTSLSLVVSTVMIGIITYVSVMERAKEIGVIRSLGGRKKDVSHLFNAETFLLGASSGLFGLLVTYIFELIMNLTLGVHYSLGMIANLPFYGALAVLAGSILLTVIAGLIPSRSAAKQDPAVALRTE